ncbi:MAG: CDP-diacylglycerol--glycerol-3-phosphate 3-phosphatidyltransferase [Micavibrio sp.]|nr:CDP-diacylglycerol--glycerol-3-phosphate 3-phosphatidyltransferase [Micavibrio sp.]|tara:strand:- start:918 stop:1469 length:552 start_codon:yes stop_codon:yes gene_type:complete
MNWTIPNILSVFRLALLPIMVGLFFIPYEWAAWSCLVLYAIGAITDFLDGYLARKLNQQSEFGAMIDPISDKIFVVTILLMLVAVERVDGAAVLCVVIILTREFIVSGIREYLGPQGVKMPVTNLAKWKTTLQMVALGVLIVAPYIWGGQIIGMLLLLGATGITAYTGWGYLKKALEFLRKIS